MDRQGQTKHVCYDVIKVKCRWVVGQTYGDRIKEMRMKVTVWPLPSITNTLYMFVPSIDFCYFVLA